MKTLDEIAIACGTDKSSLSHNYTPYYDMFFSPLRGSINITLMEIGIWEGGSLKMWKEYFQDGLILGTDRDNKEQYIADGIGTMIMDQSEIKDLEHFRKFYHGVIQIIIDDGSHNAEDQILSFKTLFPSLKPGGFYCIEDCLCSYDRERWGKNANVIDYIQKLIGDVNMNGKMSNYHICSNKQKEIYKYDTLNTLERTIEWVFMSCGLCIVKKMGESK